jgi:hypothetical protein
MSLVGPRPQPTHFDRQYSGDVPRYLERRLVRPGLTGWAEVNYLRGAAPISDRTMYDVYYIENWSLVLDFCSVTLTSPASPGDDRVAAQRDMTRDAAGSRRDNTDSRSRAKITFPRSGSRPSYLISLLSSAA